MFLDFSLKTPATTFMPFQSISGKVKCHNSDFADRNAELNSAIHWNNNLSVKFHYFTCFITWCPILQEICATCIFDRETDG